MEPGQSIERKRVIKSQQLLIVFVIWGVCISCYKSRIQAIPPEAYSSIDTNSVFLSTADTITLTHSDSAFKQPVRAKLTNNLVTEVNLIRDSLSFNYNRYLGAVPLSLIDSIRFWGMYDSDLGLISESELAPFRGSMPTTYALGYGLLGNILGSLGAVGIMRLGGDDPLSDGNTGLAIAGLTFFVVVQIYSIKYGSRTGYEVDDRVALRKYRAAQLSKRR